MSYKGKWVINPKHISDDGEISMIEIIDERGEQCFTKNGKAYSKNELDFKWIRAERVIQDPFSRPDLNLSKHANEAGINIEKPKEYDLDALEKEIGLGETKTKIVQPIADNKPEETKEEKLINTLKQLGATSTIGIETEVTIPIDINVLKTLLSTSHDMNKDLFIGSLVKQNSDEILAGIIDYLKKSL